MRPCTIISVLLVLEIVLAFWCFPTRVVSSHPAENKPRLIYIITHRPTKKQHRVTVTRKPVRLTEIHLKN